MSEPLSEEQEAAVERAWAAIFPPIDYVRSGPLDDKIRERVVPILRAFAREIQSLSPSANESAAVGSTVCGTTDGETEKSALLAFKESAKALAEELEGVESLLSDTNESVAKWAKRAVTAEAERDDWRAAARTREETNELLTERALAAEAALARGRRGSGADK